MIILGMGIELQFKMYSLKCENHPKISLPEILGPSDHEIFTPSTEFDFPA